MVADIDRTIAFYRQLGLTITDAPEWPPGSGARHTSITMPNGFSLEFDNLAGARTWNPGQHRSGGGPGVMGFVLPSAAAVDDLYIALIEAGHRERQAPHDAFWGGRYAIVLDPDDNQVGLMGPIHAQRAFMPKH